MTFGAALGLLINNLIVSHWFSGVLHSQWHRNADAAALRRSSQEALPAWCEC